LLAYKHQMHSARAWETPTDVVHAGARANGAQEQGGEVRGGGRLTTSRRPENEPAEGA